MKRYKKIISFLILTIVLVGLEVKWLNPIEAFGQSKEKSNLSQRSRRDPFSLPPGVHLLSGMTMTPETKKTSSKTEGKLIEMPPSLKVNAILIGDHIRLAMIDRHIVTIGDWIHNEKVIDIEKDRVILGKGDQTRALFLAQSPVLLTVEDCPPLSTKGEMIRGTGEKR